MVIITMIYVTLFGMITNQPKNLCFHPLQGKQSRVFNLIVGVGKPKIPALASWYSTLLMPSSLVLQSGLIGEFLMCF